MNDSDHPFLVAARKLAYELSAQAFLDAARKLHAHLAARELERCYNPNWPTQPRVPRGHPDGGQWTDGGGGSGGQADSDAFVGGESNDDLHVPGGSIADQIWPETPDDFPVVQVTNRPRGSGFSRTIAGRQFSLTQRQATELAMAEMRADAAVARVRTIEPNWHATDQVYATVEGLIAANNAVAREAEARFIELSARIGGGPFAGGSSLARGPKRNFTAAEREEINRYGRETGCHTCGTMDPGTFSGNWVMDHQWPNVVNPAGHPQRLYPQCLICSRRQGGWLKNNWGK